MADMMDDKPVTPPQSRRRAVERRSQGAESDLAARREQFFGDNLAFAIMVLSNMVSRNTTSRVLASAALSIHEWRTLRLVQMFGPLVAVDIIDTLAMDKTTVSRNITALYEHGFVQLHPNPKDRRHTLISVTPAGAAKIAAILPMDEQADAAYERHLTDAERRQLSKLLLKLYRGSKQSYDELAVRGRSRQSDA